MKKIPFGKNQFVIVDDDDYSILSKHCLTQSGINPVEFKLYADKRVLIVPLSHMILKVPVRNKVIHINGDNLDFRKENLLAVNGSNYVHKFSNTCSKNKQTSKYRGVCLETIKYKNNHYRWWKGQLEHLGQLYRKRFKSEVDAAIWYNEKARELYGEYAYQNKIK